MQVTLHKVLITMDWVKHDVSQGMEGYHPSLTSNSTPLCHLISQLITKIPCMSFYLDELHRGSAGPNNLVKYTPLLVELIPEQTMR